MGNELEKLLVTVNSVAQNETIQNLGTLGGIKKLVDDLSGSELKLDSPLLLGVGLLIAASVVASKEKTDGSSK